MQFEFKQSFVDAAKLAYTEAFVIDEGEVLAFLVEVAGHAVKPQGKLAVRDLAGCQEAGNCSFW